MSPSSAASCLWNDSTMQPGMSSNTCSHGYTVSLCMHEHQGVSASVNGAQVLLGLRSSLCPVHVYYDVVFVRCDVRFGLSISIKGRTSCLPRCVMDTAAYIGSTSTAFQCMHCQMQRYRIRPEQRKLASRVIGFYAAAGGMHLARTCSDGAAVHGRREGTEPPCAERAVPSAA